MPFSASIGTDHPCRDESHHPCRDESHRRFPDHGVWVRDLGPANVHEYPTDGDFIGYEDLDSAEHRGRLHVGAVTEVGGARERLAHKIDGSSAGSAVPSVKGTATDGR